MSSIVGISQSTANAPDIWNSAAERLERLDRSGAAAEAERTEQKSGPASLNDHTQPNMERYVHGQDLERAGLYQVFKDKEGNQKIVFDAPGQKVSEAAKGEGDKAEEVAEEAKSLGQALVEQEATDGEHKKKKGDGITVMETTGYCKVEAELKKLKQEKAKLSQQMKGCADDPDKQQEMKNRLQQIESELHAKDSKAYHDAHDRITSQRIVKRPNE